MLEPDGMKVACPVLRGLGAGNGLRLLDKSVMRIIIRVVMLNKRNWTVYA